MEWDKLQLKRSGNGSGYLTPIEHLEAEFRQYLHMPDPGALYALMGAVAGNMLDGEPVWLMLVGPPGCGKTGLLNSTLKLDRVHEGTDISSKGAFLSGT